MHVIKTSRPEPKSLQLEIPVPEYEKEHPKEDDGPGVIEIDLTGESN